MFKKTFQSFIFVVVFVVGLLWAGQAQASIPIDDTPCSSTAYCVEQYGEGAFCAGRNGCQWPSAVSGAIPEVTELGEALEAQEKYNLVSQNSFNYDNLGIISAAAMCYLVPGEPCPQDQVTAAASIGKMMAAMYENPAANTEIYVADLLNTAGIATPAYAQGQGGLGFASLNPILETWKLFRNIAFVTLVFAMLVIGFMIMFRSKVGQAAVTAQQAIPQIIIALLAITFSYPIAGLLIDFMYIFMAFVIGIFGADQGKFLAPNAFDLGRKLVTGSFTTAYEAVGSYVEGTIFGPFNIANLAGVAVGVIVAIAIVFAMFKLFFELLKTYVTILLSITLAPLLLMTGAIPGRNPFMGWVKSLIANLAAFPTVLIILLIFDKLTGSLSGGSGVNLIQNGGFAPPYLLGTAQPGEIVTFIIGLGLLLIISDLVKQAKKTLGAGEGVFSQFGTAFIDSVKKGYEGGQLIPGVGLTDTSRYGISGKNILARPFFGTEQSRKAAERNDLIGKISRYTGGYGLMGTPNEYLKRRAAKISQDQNSEPKGRDTNIKDKSVQPTTNRQRANSYDVDNL